MQAFQALVGVSVIVLASFVVIFWTKMGRYAQPVVNAIKKGRDIAHRRRDLT